MKYFLLSYEVDPFSSLVFKVLKAKELKSKQSSNQRTLRFDLLLSTQSIFIYFFVSSSAPLFSSQFKAQF